MLPVSCLQIPKFQIQIFQEEGGCKTTSWRSITTQLPIGRPFVAKLIQSRQTEPAATRPKNLCEWNPSKVRKYSFRPRAPLMTGMTRTCRGVSMCKWSHKSPKTSVNWRRRRRLEEGLQYQHTRQWRENDETGDDDDDDDRIAKWFISVVDRCRRRECSRNIRIHREKCHVSELANATHSRFLYHDVGCCISFFSVVVAPSLNVNDTGFFPHLWHTACCCLSLPAFST